MRLTGPCPGHGFGLLAEVKFQPSYGLITDLGELREYVDQLRKAGRPLSFDIETGYSGESRDKGSLHPEENFVVGISLTNTLKWSRYVPLRHDTGPNLDSAAVADILYPPLVEDRDAEGKPLGVAHGGKFELRVLRPWFNEFLGTSLTYQDFRLRSDTMLESYALAVSRFHGLKDLTEEQEKTDTTGFWHKQLELEELYPDKLTFKQKKQIRFNVLDSRDPKVVRYVCEDTLFALAHHLLRYPKLQAALAESPARGVGFIWKLEMAVLPVVCEMEDEGIWYDWNAMREWARRAEVFAGRYLEEVREDFGLLRGSPLEASFNFGSPPQLRKLLYEDCGMPVTHWTKGGKSGNKQPGTDAKVALKHLSKAHGEVARYLEWKRLTKLHRDFLGRFEDMYSFAEDGRVHPSWIQHGVPAGRFANGDPNVQQSPKKYHYSLRDGSEFDFNFRDMIGAPEGWYQLGFDLAQCELRGVAGLADEHKMFEAFTAGIDIHSVTASLLFGVPVEEVTEEQRDVGKTMGLALVYGLTEEGLADRLGITRDEAVELFALFHAAYPRIKEWTDRTIREAQETGFVSTWWGRLVRIWNYVDAREVEWKGQRGRARMMRLEGDRTAGNAPVQGSASGDYMKLVMVRSEAALRRAGLKDRVRLVMNIHDALEWYVRKDVDFNEVIAVLEPAVVFDVPGWPPMVAEWHAGLRWGSVRALEKGPGGQFRIKGSPREDERIDLSEEDEDDVAPPPNLVLPKRSPEPVVVELPMRPPAQASAAGPPRMVVIELTGLMPEAAVPRLVGLLHSVPGPNTVLLRTADGKQASLRGTCGITPDWQADISVICGGAVVRYDEASADLGVLADGLEL